MKGMAEGGRLPPQRLGASTEIGGPVLTRFLTRLFYIVLICLRVWQRRRLKTSPVKAAQADYFYFTVVENICSIIGARRNAHLT